MNAPDIPAPLCLTTREAARRLGISTQTLRRMAKRGDAPPSILLGQACVMWPEEALVAWVRARTDKERAREHA
ncbi:AlpA family transcriptional regulator [Acetobacter estunensis]|uniref:helix-turn-helix transcriptional regulator n=1 Tax=Acetobacter estunensis TaxID=104097 RepID=UPI001C2DA1A1|nr:helix-turn-helix domain-containing protein [Acetobacter estunensis]MBV1837177.1 helix-turn-helix domain-containing protein [Acetobacter estunensis]